MRQDIRLTYAHKIMNNEIIISREDLGLETSDSRKRAKHKFKRRELPARNDELKNSFINRTIPQWNCLPAAVAEADSVVAFKSQLAARRICTKAGCKIVNNMLDYINHSIW